MREKAALFGRDAHLVGVLSLPASQSRADRPGVILLNAGMLHRVGPNRLHVKIARELADDGFVVFRFDFSGIGDSAANADDRSLQEAAFGETQDAMDYVGRAQGKERFVLAGICSGADVALDAACRDPRVVGAVLINGDLLSGAAGRRIAARVEDATQKRYYRSRLLDYRSWRRLITGKSDFRRLGRFLLSCIARLRPRKRALPEGSEFSQRWSELVRRGLDALLVYSEGSSALDAYRLILEKQLRLLRPSGRVAVEVIDKSDHVFTLLWTQRALMDVVRRWVNEGSRSWSSAAQARERAAATVTGDTTPSRSDVTGETR